MSVELPKLIAINHDNYHAEFVGKTADGNQFFLTTPFDPASPTDPGNEFVALYQFDKNGDLIEALSTHANVSQDKECLATSAFGHSQYLNPEKHLLTYLIDEFGPRNKMDAEARDALCKKRLDHLGEVEFGRIEIAHFSIERFGITFGLIPNELEDEDDELSITLEPGNYMAFYEPWDSGDYDT